MKNKKFLTALLLTAIIALGFFLRTYNIDNAPPGIYPDEAVNGEDALRALEMGEFQWFYPANNGREGLFMNLIAFLFYFFGASPLTLKLPAIIFGTLTILGTYLLSKELFRKERIALIAAFLTSVGFWAINFNRISFRANMLPFVLVFTFYFIFKGLRTKKYLDFALGGLIFGIGMHTYIAFRIAPLILFAALISFILTRPNFLKNYWKAMLTFFLFSIVSAAPMFYTFYTHPEYLESRSASISVLSPEVNEGKPVQTLLKSLGLSLIKYNFVGDMNWRHNYPPYPILDTVTGIGFLFGIIYSLYRLLKLFWLRLKEKIRNTEMDSHVLLISWFFVMLIPEFMTAEGLPHALRAIGGFPAVFILSALTFDYLIERSQNKTPLFKKINYSLIIAILIFVGIFNSLKYHVFWANKVETARSFERILMDVSDYLKTVPPQTEKFIIAENMQRIPIKVFNWSMPNLSYFHPSEITKINPKTGNFMIIMTDYKEETAQSLLLRFPNLRPQEIKNKFGLSYYILK